MHTSWSWRRRAADVAPARIGVAASAVLTVALVAAGLRVGPDPARPEIEITAGPTPRPGTPAPTTPTPPAAVPETPPLSAPSAPATAAPTAADIAPDAGAGADPADTAGTLVVPDAGPTARPDGDGARRPAAPADHGPPPSAFAQRFPDHAAAVQDPDEESTTRWALLIGINEHQGRTRDNLGSRQDAEALAAHLRSLGWRDDHVLLLRDGDATRDMIVAAIRWLADKTDGDSVAVFHYTGHTKQWPGRDVDGDGETTDEALWPSDNRHIPDGEWTALMGAVDAGRLWINIGACEAAGYVDPGLARPGRIITYSSAEDEKSYEDPAAGHSVWGSYLIVEALQEFRADRDGDGAVSVEDAVTYAVPRAAERTRGQRYGAQNGGVIDQVDGAFELTIPPRPEPAPAPTTDDPGRGGDDDDGPEDDGGCLLVCRQAPARRW